MAYDLRYEPWIPWLRRDGAVEWGPPTMLVDRLRDNPVVALAAPRPDFDGALQEFLIGLLTVSLHPEDEDAWLERWNSPPTPEELRVELDALPPAFDLDGDGPRFFQDISAVDLSEGTEWSVESLLIDTPGSDVKEASRRRVITDLFVKPARIEQVGRPTAAMALITLQTYAPEGGRGHLTSMRGGGPLTTLVDPRVDGGKTRASEQPLWQKLWANVETGEQLAARSGLNGRNDAGQWADVFPWLAPTRESAPPARCVTTPGDGAPLQAYFGMPRRIRLEFTGPGSCAVTGVHDAATVQSFRMRTYGVDYEGWQHPLSPYYHVKATNEWLAMHGRADGIAWRDWIGLTLRIPDASADRRPAAVVADFWRRAERIGRPVVRLHAFGYAMTHAKAIAWTDSEMPLFPIADSERQQLLRNTATRLTNATVVAASAVFDAVKTALFGDPKNVPGDLSQVKAELWAMSEDAFFDAIRTVAASRASGDTVDAVCRTFAAIIESQAAAVFDRWCMNRGIGPDAMRRLVRSRYTLMTSLRGKKLMDALELGLPARTTKARSRKERKT